MASTSPAISKEALTIEKGTSYTLKVSGATGVTWSSSDTSVATVNSKGKVTGKLRGTATITATFKQYPYKASCLVSVVNKGSSSVNRYIVLMLDISSSMRGTPLAKEKAAAVEFCKKILASGGSNNIAIVSFGSYANLEQNFTSSLSLLNTAIQKSSASGSTNMYDSFAWAKKLLGGITAKNASKYVVVCSDGFPANKSSTYAIDDELKEKGYFIYSLGFFHSLTGSNLEEGKTVMKRLASKDGDVVIDNTKDLNNAFKKIIKKITQFQVTFNPNGGTVSKKSKTVTAGKKYGTLPAPERSGYTFQGWYTKKSGGTKVTSSTVSKEKTKQTLYAHWKKNKPSLPSGAVSWNGHHYKVYTTSATWATANKLCKKAGGHLVTITSTKEQAYISKLIKNTRKNLFWIGLYQSGETKWSWVTGEKVKYTNWALNEPSYDDDNGKNRAQIYNVWPWKPETGSRGQWNDSVLNPGNYSGWFFDLCYTGYVCEWDY